MGSTILTVYLEFNVDEHELNNNEEEAAAIMLPRARARVADEKARAELRPWVCCMSRMGSSLSTGSLDSSAAPAVPHHVLSTISRQI